MPRSFALLWFDLQEAFDSPLWVAYSWGFFFFEFFVYGQLISTLVVKPPNYLFYYSVGLVVLIVFNVASWAGRSFVDSAHEGRLRYLLSLPIGRTQLFLERTALGSLVSVTRLLPPLLFILWYYGLLTISLVISSLVVLTLVSLGVTGLMISLSFVAFKSFDMYSAIVAALSALLIRFSTMYYPLSYMPGTVANISLFNPLTYGTDLFRSILGFNGSLLLDPYFAVVVVASVAVGTMFLGITISTRYIEGVKSV